MAPKRPNAHADKAANPPSKKSKLNETSANITNPLVEVDVVSDGISVVVAGADTPSVDTQGAIFLAIFFFVLISVVATKPLILSRLVRPNT